MPNTIIIFHRTFSLVAFDDNEMDKRDACGYFDDENSEIGIYEGLIGQEAAETLLHEIEHAIIAITKPGKKEERVVNLLAVGLSTVFKINPALLTWWINAMNHEQ